MRWQTNIQYVYGSTLSVFFEYTYCIRRDFSIDRKYTVCIWLAQSVFLSYTYCIRPDFSIERSVYNFLRLKKLWRLERSRRRHWKERLFRLRSITVAFKNTSTRQRKKTSSAWHYGITAKAHRKSRNVPIIKKQAQFNRDSCEFPTRLAVALLALVAFSYGKVISIC